MGTKKQDKKKRFGQATLSGTTALDWVKPGRTAHPLGVTMGNGASLQDAGYRIPDWAIEKDAWIIHQRDDPTGFSPRTPVLVTQRSIIRALDRWASAAEDDGAKADDDEHGNVTLMVSEDITTVWTFTRGEGKFAPYVVEVGSEA